MIVCMYIDNNCNYAQHFITKYSMTYILTLYFSFVSFRLTIESERRRNNHKIFLVTSQHFACGIFFYTHMCTIVVVVLVGVYVWKSKFEGDMKTHAQWPIYNSNRSYVVIGCVNGKWKIHTFIHIETYHTKYTHIQQRPNTVKIIVILNFIPIFSVRNALSLRGYLCESFHCPLHMLHSASHLHLYIRTAFFI